MKTAYALFTFLIIAVSAFAQTANEDSRWSDGKCGGAVVTGLAWGISTIVILSRIVFY